MITAVRYHDFCAGHRVVGHENKCRHLHGHNYRVTFHVTAVLDQVGRVLDFSVIKARLCDWLEEHWDHRMVLWEEDPLIGGGRSIPIELADSLRVVPFNPTAENMATYLLEVVGPGQLLGTGARLVQVDVEETRKCSASASAPTSIR